MPVDLSKLEIQKNTPIPLYYQLKNELLAQIHLSNSGDPLPTEFEIVNALGISRSTVRQAFNELVNEGYVHRDKGRGTFISKPKVDEHFFQKLDSFNNEMIAKGFVPSTSVLSCHTIQGNSAINKRLNISVTEKLFYLCRLRFANSEPLVYLETYLPYNRFPELDKEDFTAGSLYGILEEKYSARVNGATRDFEAAPATREEAKLLMIKQNAPIMLVRSRAYDDSNTAIEYSVARYRGDRNSFTVELRR